MSPSFSMCYQLCIIWIYKQVAEMTCNDHWIVWQAMIVFIATDLLMLAEFHENYLQMFI